MPQSKSAQNARIGALWTLIDVEHVRKQIGGYLKSSLSMPRLTSTSAALTCS